MVLMTASFLSRLICRLLGHSPIERCPVTRFPSYETGQWYQTINRWVECHRCHINLVQYPYEISEWIQLSQYLWGEVREIPISLSLPEPPLTNQDRISLTEIYKHSVTLCRSLKQVLEKEETIHD